MSIKNKLKKLKGSSNDPLGDITYALVSKFRWDYDTLMKQPIPFINLLLNKMKKEAEEHKRNMNKTKRK